MAEGPVVHFFAERFHRVLAGKCASVEFGINKLKGRGDSFADVPVSGVDACGEQFRIRFGDGRIVLVHLLMWGTWRIYEGGEEWDKPRSRARLILWSDDVVAVAFSAPIVRVFEDEGALAESKWGDSGEDPLRDDYSRAGAVWSLRGEADRPIGIAIMDQSVLAGVGNILRNEILFLSRVDPRRTVGSLGDDELDRILDWTEELMERWLRNMGERKNWIHVYRRSGNPCGECGDEIEFFRQDDRITYVCPTCQR